MKQNHSTNSRSPRMKNTHATNGKNKRRNRPKVVGVCLIIMPFKEPFDSYYSLIFEPAVIGAGLKAARGDSLFRPSPIMADIWQMIQDAKVLVAELTQKNANVFYELGLAHALGKPVVLVSETIEDVPFDLQPLRVILYDKTDPAWGIKLKNDLIASLEETISDVTNAVPPMFRKVVPSQAPQDSDLSVRLSELERRVAAILPSEQRTFGGRHKIELRDGVDWSAVSHLLRNGRKMGHGERFDSREHAVAWTIAQLNTRSVEYVRRRLSERFGGWTPEANKVLNLAIIAQGGGAEEAERSSKVAPS